MNDDASLLRGLKTLVEKTDIAPDLVGPTTQMHLRWPDLLVAEIDRLVDIIRERPSLYPSLRRNAWYPTRTVKGRKARSAPIARREIMHEAMRLGLECMRERIAQRS